MSDEYGKWISVKDRLPNYLQEVFATGLDYKFGPGRHYARCKFYNNSFYEMSGSCMTDDTMDYITHWMPLPATPKE